MKHLDHAWWLVGFTLAAGCGLAQADPTVVTNTFSVNKVIPDGSASGLTDTHVLDFTGQQLFSISDLKLTLQISGGFNGDYYGYISHNGKVAILLNRPGRTSTNPDGYAGGGLNITLSDTGPDIHNYEASSNADPLTGIWGPDGRNVDPSLVLDTDPRTSLLSNFVGEDPSGQWTLFLADVDFGEQGTLVNWGLVITATPEPATWAVGLLGLGGMWLVRKRARRS